MVKGISNVSELKSAVEGIFNTPELKWLKESSDKCHEAFAATVLSGINGTHIPDYLVTNAPVNERQKLRDEAAANLNLGVALSGSGCSLKKAMFSKTNFKLEFSPQICNMTGEIAALAVYNRLQGRGVKSEYHGRQIRFTLEGENLEKMEALITAQKDRHRAICAVAKSR